MVEIIAHHRGDSWQAVYTVRFAEAIYVLHAFQKKSKRGIATTKRDTELIRQSPAFINPAGTHRFLSNRDSRILCESGLAYRADWR